MAQGPISPEPQTHAQFTKSLHATCRVARRNFASARSQNRASTSQFTRLPMFSRCHNIAANERRALESRGGAEQTKLLRFSSDGDAA